MARSEQPVMTFMTGQDLLADLEIPEDDEACWAARSHALGYVSGIIDAHQIMQAAEGFAAVFSFPPVSTGELNDLIARELARHPHDLDANAAGLVLRILQEHFPPTHESH
jgi:hypothetical protein